MNRLALFLSGIAVATTLFMVLPAMGQSDAQRIVTAKHQVPVIVSVELPTSITDTTPVQFTLMFNIESSTAISGSDVISTNVRLDAAVLSEILEASVDIRPAIDSEATIVIPTSAQLPSTTVPTTSLAVANRDSNLRECPSARCKIIGFVRTGQEVQVVGQSDDGQWYQLASGEWIASFLVDHVPDSLPLVTAVPEETVVATATVIPPQEPPAVAPILEFTFVPPYGSNKDLQGRVRQVDPSDYKVVVYIYLTGWWIKPEFNAPLTFIGSDGQWTTDITTGGDDHLATQVAAFLVPDGYDPPLLDGDETLPQTLFENAVAYMIEERAPTEPIETGTPSANVTSTLPSSITLTATQGEVSGKVSPSAYCTSAYKVALYAKTDMWYVQPYADSRRNIKINKDCTWSSTTNQWDELVAFLVPIDYDQPQTILEYSCPPLDLGEGSGIFAAACFP